VSRTKVLKLLPVVAALGDGGVCSADGGCN
jgi:hypothetical protein